MATPIMHMTDNASVQGRQDRYALIRIDTVKALKSWRKSLYSFEWMLPDGSLRALDDLPMIERQKRLEVEKALKNGEALERPILGVGLLDNIEIGAGKAVFLTLAAHGHDVIEVYISRNVEGEFKSFLA